VASHAWGATQHLGSAQARPTHSLQLARRSDLPGASARRLSKNRNTQPAKFILAQMYVLNTRRFERRLSSWETRTSPLALESRKESINPMGTCNGLRV